MNQEDFNVAIEELTETHEKVDASAIDSNAEIPIRFIANKGTKFAKLVDNSIVSSPYKLRDQDHSIKFNSSVFLRYVDLKISESEYRADKITVSFVPVNINNIVVENLKKIEAGWYRATLNCVVSEIVINPNYAFFGRNLVDKIDLIGWSEGLLSQVTSKIDGFENTYELFVRKYKKFNEDLTEENDNVLSLKNSLEVEIENSRSILASVNSSIAESEKNCSNLDNEISQREKILIELNDEISHSNNNLKSLKQDVSVLTDSIAEKESKNSILNQDVIKVKSELKSLLDNKALFSDEFGSYVEQGTKNERQYWLFSLIPIMIIAWVMYQLFDSAEAVISLPEVADFDGIFGVLISRLPFTVVSLFLIHSCYHICKFFITKVTALQRDRLDLSKISILAKDISRTSVDDLDIEDEIKYELRIKLKMDFLKGHLSRELGPNYEYEAEKHLSRALVPKYFKFWEFLKLNKYDDSIEELKHKNIESKRAE